MPVLRRRSSPLPRNPPQKQKPKSPHARRHNHTADRIPDGAKLRQLAEHRGLKLIKSRRRKPGVGDYGKFGLTDTAGKALLGIGDNGPTASAADIAAYLRAGTVETWQESASSIPDKPAAKPKPPSSPPKDAAPAKPKARTKPKAPAPQPPVAKTVPTPELAIRPAEPPDAEAIARLLSRLHGIAIDGEEAGRNLAQVKKAGGGVLLAVLGRPIGCCGWAVVPTLQHGPIGRITALFVDQDHRRRGIASQMLAAARQALAGTGCTMIEAMSDIAIDNAHNFFRARKFEQASYRFICRLGD